MDANIKNIFRPNSLKLLSLIA